jgi:hypothetical protein
MRVEELMRSGWVPQGGIHYWEPGLLGIHDQWSQAMVRGVKNDSR